MSGSFGRELLAEVSSSREGVEAMLEHALGVVVCHRADLHAQVRQHGVRTPAAENASGVRVDAGAQERGGTARAQALHSE